MTLWERWLRHPQALWLRKAIFQVHLWLGIGVGLYIAVIGVSGPGTASRPFAISG